MRMVNRSATAGMLLSLLAMTPLAVMGQSDGQARPADADVRVCPAGHRVPG